MPAGGAGAAVAGLREATDDDSWGLIALVGACWAEYPGCVMDIGGECAELLAPARYYHGLGGELWVLPEGSWIGACVGLRPGDGQRFELVKLYVARHLRGRGLGRALVEMVDHHAQARGAHEIELWSDSRFHDAHRLYERCGYRATGATRELHDLSVTTELAFNKQLPAT